MRRYILICFILVFFTILNTYEVKAAGEEDYGDYTSIDDYDFSDVEDILYKNNSTFNYEDTVKKLVSGDVEGSMEDLGDEIINSIFSEINYQKSSIIKVIIIGIVAALFTNISSVFLNSQISETAFYVTYMLLMTILTASYVVAADIVSSALRTLIEFMNALVPVYIMAISFSAGSSSALAFFEFSVVIIAIVEKIILNVLLPMIYIYMMINLINNITKESILTKAAELVKTIIEWSLKTIMAFVIGINVIQGLICPILDSFKTSTLGRAASVIPGVGNIVNSVAGVIIGAGTIIKNGIGVAALIAIMVICVVPLIKIVIFALSFKAAGAILEPVSDKRVTECVSGMYESAYLLLKTLFNSVVLFLLTIGIVCATTNTSYLGM